LNNILIFLFCRALSLLVWYPGGKNGRCKRKSQNKTEKCKIKAQEDVVAEQ
jgi:hypothetical protein